MKGGFVTSLGHESLKYLHIENFKSIESSELNLKKVNIFLGNPNVGKSNILEAIGLLSAIGHHDIIRNNVRLNLYNDIFFKKFLDRDLSLQLKFNQNEDEVVNIEIKYEKKEFRVKLNGKTIAILLNKGIDKNQLDDKIRAEDHDAEIVLCTSSKNMEKPDRGFSEIMALTDQEIDIFEKFKFYKFLNYRISSLQLEKSNDDYEGSHRYHESRKNVDTDALLPPDGSNLYDVINNFEKNQLMVRDILSDFDLKLVINRNSNKIEVQEEDENGVIITHPLSSLADTIQSMIFHSLISKSNKNSIIALEEPEIHTFPFYSRRMAEYIAEDPSNQYLITTHNQYFVNSLMQKCGKDELQVFIVQKKNNRTVINELSIEEIRKLNEDDLFSSVKYYDEWKND